MSDAADILVLAGRRHGVELAGALGASVLRLRPDLPVPQREVPGPFDDALARGWRGVICAAHRFDQASGARVAALHPDLPLAHMLGTVWGPDTEAYDDWVQVPSVEAAVPHMLQGLPAFAATGRESEPALAGFDGPVYLRQNTPHNGAPSAPNICYEFATGAFDAASERALFVRLGVKTLVARNTGGQRGYGKVEAARSLGMRMILIEAGFAGGTVLPDLEAARAWIAAL